MLVVLITTNMIVVFIINPVFHFHLVDIYRGDSVPLSELLSHKLYSIGRHGRSRMPYLGQDLDKLGIVRAVPVFNAQGKQQDNGLPSFMKGKSSCPSHHFSTFIVKRAL